jgi:hypothetical protein
MCTLAFYFQVFSQYPADFVTYSEDKVSLLHEHVNVRNTIPEARIAVIDGRRHEIYADEPEACTAALVKFLRSLE